MSARWVWSLRSTWAATVVGTAVGIGGGIFRLGNFIWPPHPGLALFFVTLATALAAQIAVEHEVRSAARRAQS